MKTPDHSHTPFTHAQNASDTNRRLEAVDRAYQEPLWEFVEIGRDRWNKNYPYRLAVYKRGDNGDWTLDEKRIPPFTLPLPPESLTISTPFAITTSATLGGIVEEHNGAPFKMLTISGTTGVLPLRGKVNSQALDARSIQASVFAGATTAFQNAQSLFQPKRISNVVPRADVDSGDLSYGTGYYQYKLLERFFDAYAGFKKTAEGRNYVMAVEMWKDSNIFLVSPIAVNLNRSASSPLEYNFSLQFKAWKRVQPTNGGEAVLGHLPIARDPNLLARALNGLQEGQRAMEAGKKILQGVRADVKYALGEPLRQTILFCKDVLGVVNTATDFPENIITDLREPLLETISLRSTAEATGANFKSSVNRAQKAVSDLSVQVSKAAINSGRLGQLSDGKIGYQDGLKTVKAAAHPANKIFAEPADNFEYFQTVIPGNLQLRPETQEKIQAEKRRIKLLKREDFEKARDSVLGVLNDFENSIGAGNSTYESVYRLPTRPSSRVPTDLDYELIYHLNEIVMHMDKLAASATINQNEVSAIDFIAGLANRAGIAFQTPASKFLVPFPYGSTLEQLSVRYLGTADRWHEIAVLNGLQAPYVDEIGFSLTLLANGYDNDVYVSDVSQLFVNQSVWLSSSNQPRTQRRISKIRTISPNQHVVTLTGEKNLSQYTIAAGAFIQAFKPNTINSQMSVYIPSDIIAEDTDFRYKAVPGVDYFDPLVRAGGIDLLLTSDGDLVVTPDGDGRLAVGLTNIVQKVKLVLNTPRGSLMHHENYGFPVQVGDSTADMSAQDILRICQGLFADDPTFTGVESASVLKTGPTVKITLSVGIAGTQTVVPITVEINR